MSNSIEIILEKRSLDLGTQKTGLELLAINESPLIASDRARAEFAARKAELYMGTPLLREINGTYQNRPPEADFPNVTWLGQTDATLHASFVAYDPATGKGDIWIEINL